MKRPTLKFPFMIGLILCTQMIGINMALCHSETPAKPLKSDVAISQPEKIKLTKTNGKSRVIPRFKTIKVWLKDSKTPLKGKYTVLSDSTISIEGEVVRLTDIVKISGFTWPSVFAPALLAGGGASLGFGVAYLVFGGFAAYAGYGVGLLAAGAVLTGAGTVAIVGGIVILYYSKTYRNIGEKWQIQFSS